MNASSQSPSGKYGYGAHIINMSFGNDIYDEAVRAATYEAYINGVSLVASRGEDKITNIPTDEDSYPACYDNTILTSVGASNVYKEKSSYSFYGKKMDLLAPGGDFDSSIVYSPYGRTSWGNFIGTSASAPFVAGVIGLLRSEALNRNWNNLEPEDYDGMLKASAFNIGPDGYDELTGWGHLQADTIFNMLNNGYRIFHISDTSGFQKGNWSDTVYIKFFNLFYDNSIDSIRLDSSVFKSRKREITGLITLSDSVGLDVASQSMVYVWGRRGNKNLGGFNASNRNYLARYTVITNARGGIVDVPGIILKDSSRVAVKTYQYELFNSNGDSLGLIPPNDSIWFNISVFQPPLTMGVEYFTRISDNIEFEIHPNPACKFINVKFSASVPSYYQIQIFDVFGNVLNKSEKEFLLSGNYKKEIQLENYQQEIYYCRFSSEKEIRTKILSIIK
ncbi:MAG: peptidase [Ignavibacteria bacterium]|nr:peptidase [Ignavibacteria bacterium]